MTGSLVRRYNMHTAIGLLEDGVAADAPTIPAGALHHGAQARGQGSLTSRRALALDSMKRSLVLALAAACADRVPAASAAGLDDIVATPTKKQEPHGAGLRA
jgi:hypothetical protein